MALLFCESFDHFTTSSSVNASSTTLSAKWDFEFDSNTSSTIGTSFGRFGTSGWAQKNTNNYLRKNLNTAVTTVIFGAAVYVETAGSYTLNRVFSFVDGATEQISIRRTVAEKLAAYRGGVLLGTSAATFNPGQYRYIEAKVFFHASTGTVEIRVDGVAVLTLTGQNTIISANASIDRVVVGGFGDNDGHNGQQQYDDIYINDDTTSDNNTYFGDIRVQAILPSAAGSSTQFARTGAATNYQAVNEVGTDGDTSYNASATPSQKDTFAFGDVTPTAGSVKAVQSVIYARKDDAGGRTFCAVYRSGGVDNDGASSPLPSSYVHILEMKPLNPTTGVAWTIIDVNAAEFGYKVVT